MFRIGELAKRYQVKTDTLRFYDKQGLLTPSSRSESGYRLYTDEDASKLHFIIRAKGIGFSLTEIMELLFIETEKTNWACFDVKKMVDVKLQDIEEKLQELTQLKSSLITLSDSCCGGKESAENCSILEALGSDDDKVRKEHPQPAILAEGDS